MNSEYLVNMSAEDMLLDDDLTLWKVLDEKGGICQQCDAIPQRMFFVMQKACLGKKLPIKVYWSIQSLK